MQTIKIVRDAIISTWNENLNDILSSPKTYTVGACVGVLVTTGLAIIATKDDCKRQAEKSPEEKIGFWDRISTFVPTIVAALSTIGCIYNINSQWSELATDMNNQLVSTQDKMALYRNTAPGLVAVINGFSGNKAEEGKQWYCLKDLSPYEDIYFESTPEIVINAEYNLNRNFITNDDASVAEFMYYLGIDDVYIKNSAYGWDVATFIDDYGTVPWIDFEHKHIDYDPKVGGPINIITFPWNPSFKKSISSYKFFPTE